MNITISPAKAQYLEQVAAGLADLPDEERDEVIQDLTAHLAELSDGEIVAVLGSPDAFVAEFRASAGLDKPGRLVGLFTLTRARLEYWSTRLSVLTSWPRARPFWVWSRGWLILSVFAATQGGVAFHNFPIPAIGGDTARGLVLVAGATWLSVWLDRSRRGSARDIASVVYSALGVWALAAGVLGGIALGYPAQFVDYESEAEMYDFPMVGHNGVAVENIYAYDLQGNPVEVLLFDQLGRPLLMMPPWVYEEAELGPRGGAVEYPGGHVTFARDDFGRIIPNLYPLELETYDEWGELRPAESPGAWSTSEGQAAETTPRTTTSHLSED